VPAEVFAREDVERVDFGQLLQQSDYVSIHTPLLAETRGLFGAAAFRQMKPTAYLINTTRGPVVDEQALVDALHSGAIAGAALDVFAKEPLPADSPLRDPALEDRLRLFSHFASAGRITPPSSNPNRGMAGRCVQGLIDVMEGNYGGNPAQMPFVVNKEAFP